MIWFCNLSYTRIITLLLSLLTDLRIMSLRSPILYISKQYHFQGFLDLIVFGWEAKLNPDRHSWFCVVATVAFVKTVNGWCERPCSWSNMTNIWKWKKSRCKGPQLPAASHSPCYAKRDSFHCNESEEMIFTNGCSATIILACINFLSWSFGEILFKSEGLAIISEYRKSNDLHLESCIYSLWLKWRNKKVG